jgi:hypothetical protein
VALVLVVAGLFLAALSRLLILSRLLSLLARLLSTTTLLSGLLVLVAAVLSTLVLILTHSNLTPVCICLVRIERKPST